MIFAIEDDNNLDDGVNLEKIFVYLTHCSAAQREMWPEIVLAVNMETWQKEMFWLWTSLYWISSIIHHMYKRYRKQKFSLCICCIRAHACLFLIALKTSGCDGNTKCTTLQVLSHETWRSSIIIFMWLLVICHYTGFSGNRGQRQCCLLSHWTHSSNLWFNVRSLKSFGWIGALIAGCILTTSSFFSLKQQRNK